MEQSISLLLLLAFPALAALVVLLIPVKCVKAIKTASILSSVGILAYTIFLAFTCRYDGSFCLTYSQELISVGKKFSSNFAVGVDGLGMLMLLLCSLLFTVAFIVSACLSNRVREYFALFFILQLGIFGVFVATDLFLFFIFWEIILIPMYAIIAIWGGKRRQFASMKYLLFTLSGSLIMLVGIIGYFLQSGSFDLITPVPISMSSQLFLFWFIFVGFAVSIPIFPFHSWLPDAHAEAPTAGSIVLSGVMLGLGSYGFLRVLFPLFPYSAKMFATFLAALGVINILYGAFMALSQTEMRRIIAWASISYMGFVVLALASLGETGFAGASLHIINHGIIFGALFLIIGALRDRTCKTNLQDFGGLYKRIPFFYGVSLLVVFATIGIPGLNGFISELTCLIAGFTGYSGQPEFKYLTGIALFGIILSAVYMLRLIHRVFSGPEAAGLQNIPDIDGRELTAIAPLCFLIIFLGIAPGTVFNMLAGTMKALAKIFQ